MATPMDGAPTSEKINPSHVTFFIVACVLIVVSSVAIVLRFWSRSLGKSIAIDDWTSLAALVMAWALTICDPILLTTIGHSGYNLALFSQEQLKVYLQLNYTSSIFYLCATALAKLAVLLFYRRVFTIKSFKPWLWTTVSLVGAYWVALVLSVILSYNPVRAFWMPWIPHTNVDLDGVYLAACVGSVVIDGIILILPQPLVWKLQISIRQKLMLTFLLCLGVFTVVAIIIRITYLQSGNIPKFGMWSVIEINMSIICGCGPMIPRLFRHYSGKAPSNMFEKNRINSSNSSWRRALRHHGKAKSDQSSGRETSPPSLEEGRMEMEDKLNNNLVHVQTDIRIQNVARDDVTLPNDPSHDW